MPKSLDELVNDLTGFRGSKAISEAIEALTSMGEEVVSPLISTFQRWTAAIPLSDVPRHDVEALKTVGFRDVVDLSTMFMSEKEFGERFNKWVILTRGVKQVLITIGEPVLEPLINALKHPQSNQYMRSSAVQILGELGDPRAIEALIQVQKHDRDEFVRKKAFEALAKLDKKPRTVLEKLSGRRRWVKE